MIREARRASRNSRASGSRSQELLVVVHLGRNSFSRQYCYMEQTAEDRMSSESASLTSSECSVVRPSVHRWARVNVLCPGGMCVAALDGLLGHPTDL
jgi:hypothetical protein